MKNSLAAVVGFCALCLVAGQAQADIVSSGASISVINAPGTVNHNDATLESNTTVMVWLEVTGNLGSAITFSDSGFSAGAANTGQRNNAGSTNVVSNTVGAGTPFESYYVFFDRTGVNTPGVNSFTLNGGTAAYEITFSAPIIGIEFNSTSLDNTDAALGGGTSYYNTTNSANRGLELANSPAERYTIFNNGRSIRIDNLTSETGRPSDGIRIVISPEPSTFALMGLGLLGFGAVVRRRRRKGVRS